MNLFPRHCREIARLLLTREERAPTRLQGLAIRLHLRLCVMCRHFNGQVRLMDEAMARWRQYTDAD